MRIDSIPSPSLISGSLLRLPAGRVFLYAPNLARRVRTFAPKPCSWIIFAAVVRWAYMASPITVANSGSASSGGMLEIGCGEASRTGLSRTFSKTSYNPSRRDPPPVSTTPITQLKHSRLRQMLARQLAQLVGARLKDFRHETAGHQARRPIAHRGDFNLVSFRDLAADGVAECFFDLLRCGHRSSESNGDVVGEVIAANGNHACVGDHAFVVHNQVCRACADIGQADAQLFFVGPQDGVG